ncbi:MAG: hypothetical protein K9L17_13400 [Clostridiales bacterium]|nr:hypothetical protein [Clostridiales bacterium]MCF8023671.1 hypothetical protein [Clostridiales bacterium]
MFKDAEIISVYTRREAIEDGQVIDVTKMAKEAGARIPTALTAAAWAEAVSVTEELETQGQDENGRLWDVLTMFTHAARNNKNSSELTYTVLVVKKPGRKPEKVTLKAVIGPGDDGKPVFTIMLPSED